MKLKELTPLEILQKQKIALQIKSDELTVAIENHAQYLQQHLVPLLRDSLVESAVSKMPLQLQNIAGNLFQRERKDGISDSFLPKVIQGITLGIAEIAPFFIKGKKGMFLSILMKQFFKWIRI